MITLHFFNQSAIKTLLMMNFYLIDDLIKIIIVVKIIIIIME